MSGEEGTSFGKRGLCVDPAKVVCVCGPIPPNVLDGVGKLAWGVGCAVGAVEREGKGMR